jgi:hypothetical protein
MKLLDKNILVDIGFEFYSLLDNNFLPDKVLDLLFLHLDKKFLLDKVFVLDNCQLHNNLDKIVNNKDLAYLD